MRDTATPTARPNEPLTTPRSFERADDRGAVRQGPNLPTMLLLGLAFLLGVLTGGPAGRPFGESQPASGGSSIWPLIVTAFVACGTYWIVARRRHGSHRASPHAPDIHLAAIEALAQAIDAKDQTSHDHVRRVQAYAVGLARAVGMSGAEVQGLKTAATLHDIGKLAVPQHILSKPGPLTEDEFHKVKIHSEVGAEILSAIPFPYPVSSLILSHHERWDGTGYPAGLRGTQIPLGARILAIVDYFDSVMSERPYHRARTRDKAVELLSAEAGGAFDPSLVSAFVEILPSLAGDVSASRADPPSDHGAVITPVPLPIGPRPSVFQDIALAHRELFGLYEIAEALGTSLGVLDSAELIASKLKGLVPFSCCVLFLYDDAKDRLRGVFATGTESDAFRDLTLRAGEGLSGRAARHRSPFVNGEPSEDLAAGGRPGTPTTLRSGLVSPLVFGQQLIGILSVYHAEAAFYRDDHCRIVSRVSQQAAAVIHNSMVFERAQEDSVTDLLTGLPNTRLMIAHVTQELARAARSAHEVALLLVDVDDFKDVNDTYGHHVGDMMLREIGRVLDAGTRPYDLCARYGGDEFVIVLSNCGRGEANSKGAELGAAIAVQPFEPWPGHTLKITVSIGAAASPEDGRTFENLLAAADARMYHQKAERRRVAAARSSAASPPARVA